VDVAKSLTTLGIGEALVTALDPKGIPTAVAPVQVLAPSSSMSAIDDAQYQRVIAASALNAKYSTPINRESAHEILQARLAQQQPAEPSDEFGWKQEQEADDFDWRGSAPKKRRRSTVSTSGSRRGRSTTERVLESAARGVAREVGRGLGRGLLGLLKF